MHPVDHPDVTAEALAHVRLGGHAPEGTRRRLEIRIDVGAGEDDHLATGVEGRVALENRRAGGHVRSGSQTRGEGAAVLPCVALARHAPGRVGALEGAPRAGGRALLGAQSGRRE